MAQLTQGEQIAVISSSVQRIEKDVDDIKRKMDSNYITKDKHAILEEKVERLEKIIYSLIAVILLAFLGAVISLVLR